MRKVVSGADCLRIQEVAAKFCNVVLTLEEADWVWERVSELAWASWLQVPPDDTDVAKLLNEFFRRMYSE